MPTGYTEMIADNDATWEKYLLRCALGFGYCIDYRDNRPEITNELPEIKPDNKWIIETIATREKQREILISMTESEIEKAADDEYTKKVKDNIADIKKQNELKVKYLTYIQQINNWQAPTSEHEELRKFAINQITKSMEWDCGTTYFEMIMPRARHMEWYINQLNKINDDITYYENMITKEKERIDKANEWIRALNNSLKKREANA